MCVGNVLLKSSRTKVKQNSFICLFHLHLESKLHWWEEKKIAPWQHRQKFVLKQPRLLSVKAS